MAKIGDPKFFVKNLPPQHSKIFENFWTKKFWSPPSPQQHQNFFEIQESFLSMIQHKIHSAHNSLELSLSETLDHSSESSQSELSNEIIRFYVSDRLFDIFLIRRKTYSKFGNFSSHHFIICYNSKTIDKNLSST